MSVVVAGNQSHLEDESFFRNLTTFIKGSMIFVVSQAWNSAIQDLIKRTNIFNDYGQLIYALGITILSIYILKIIANINKIIDNCQHKINKKCLNWFKLF